MKLCALQLLIVVSCAVIPATASNIVTNPGFESGLTGWTASPDWGSGNFAVHSGSLEAYTQCGGAVCISVPDSILFQDLTTVIGEEYDLSFWFRFQGHGPPFGPNELQTYAGGTLVSDLVNESNNHGVYQQEFTTFTATSTTTRLQFDGRNDPSFLILDDVCVDARGGACVQASAVPEPAPGLLLAVAFAIALLARKILPRLNRGSAASSAAKTP
jgi:hypothetical protein